MNLSDLKSLVSDLGFPVFVAIYLLCYHSRLLRKLTVAIVDLTIAVRSLNNRPHTPNPPFTNIP